MGASASEGPLSMIKSVSIKKGCITFLLMCTVAFFFRDEDLWLVLDMRSLAKKKQ